MTEFRYGDRIRWRKDHSILGTVVDERIPQNKPMGDFDACLPLPTAVLWDEPGEVYWEAGEDLELA